jgi:formylglycine-generating enzyme required for sulfatase activity
MMKGILFMHTHCRRLVAMSILAGAFLLPAVLPGQTSQTGKKELLLDLGTANTPVKVAFVLIPRGKFLMGSPKGEKPGKKDNEEKQHEVEITRDFYLGKYEVTRGQFAQFVSETGYKTDAEKAKNGGEGFNVETGKDEFKLEYNWRNVGFPQTDEHPVVIVSWFDAGKFCEWLSKKTGKAARLPTEAEWEYACRAGTTTRYASGDDNESRVQIGNLADLAYGKKYPKANVTKGEDGHVFTAPVGQFKPNAFGLYDMHGNVYEWCEDWFGPAYADLGAKDPVRKEKAGNANLRVIRGGAWQTGPDDGYAAARHRHAPLIGYSRTGFRVLIAAD